MTARNPALRTGGTCRRCGRLVVAPDQVCRRRTPASPFCWPDEDDRALEIEPGLTLRPGDSIEHPLLRVDDPYAEDTG